jgi:hypothetical protein
LENVDIHILWTFGIFYDRLIHFVFIWYIFPVLVSRTKNNLATLAQSPRIQVTSAKEKEVAEKLKSVIFFLQKSFFDLFGFFGREKSLGTTNEVRCYE